MKCVPIRILGQATLRCLISSRLVFNGKNCTPSAEGIIVTRLEKTTT